MCVIVAVMFQEQGRRMSKVEAVSVFKMSEASIISTWCYNPEDSVLSIELLWTNKMLQNKIS